jgi:hypothetical protein
MLISKIALTLPVFFRLLGILAIVLYVFAVIGIEIFYISPYSDRAPSDYAKEPCILSKSDPPTFDGWTTCEYASLDTFWGTSLLLFQVMVGTGYSYLIFEGQDRTGSLLLAVVYFHFFNFLSMLIVANVFKG